MRAHMRDTHMREGVCVCVCPSSLLAMAMESLRARVREMSSSQPILVRPLAYALVGERENHFLTCVWPQNRVLPNLMLLVRDSPNSTRTNCFQLTSNMCHSSDSFDFESKNLPIR